MCVATSVVRGWAILVIFALATAGHPTITVEPSSLLPAELNVKRVTLHPFVNSSHCLTVQPGLSSIVLTTQLCRNSSLTIDATDLSGNTSLKIDLSQCFLLLHRSSTPNILKISPCDMTWEYAITADTTDVLRRVKEDSNVMIREWEDMRRQEWAVEEVSISVNDSSSPVKSDSLDDHSSLSPTASTPSSSPSLSPSTTLTPLNNPESTSAFNVSATLNDYDDTEAEDDDTPKTQWHLRFLLNQPVTKIWSNRWMTNLRDTHSLTGTRHTLNPDYSYLPQKMPQKWRNTVWSFVEGTGFYRSGFMCWKEIEVRTTRWSWDRGSTLENSNSEDSNGHRPRLRIEKEVKNYEAQVCSTLKKKNEVRSVWLAKTFGS